MSKKMPITPINNVEQLAVVFEELADIFPFED